MTGEPLGKINPKQVTPEQLQAMLAAQMSAGAPGQGTAAGAPGGQQPPAAPSGWRERIKGLLWLLKGDDADLATLGWRQRLKGLLWLLQGDDADLAISGASKFTALGRRPEGEDEALPRGAPPGV